MNYCVISFLSDQFVKLNEEFSKCIGDRGEFTGNFEQFRRRHQAVTHTIGRGSGSVSHDQQCYLLLLPDRRNYNSV